MSNINNPLNALNKSFMNRLFRQVNNVVWDLQTGNLGILTKNDEIATYTAPKFETVGTGQVTDDHVEGTKEEQVSDGFITINPFSALSVAIPAYGQNIQLSEVKVGDMIVNDSGEAIGWVEKVHKNGESFTIHNIKGSTTRHTPPKVNMMGMGQTGVMVVRSLIQSAGGESGFKNIQNSLMPMLMLSGGDLGGMELDKIMPMMLMMNSQGTGDNNMMQMMLMMKMMGNGNF